MSTVQEYEDQEIQHDIAFCCFKRRSCFAHTLQLVVRTFDQNSASTTMIKNVHKLVNKVNKSSKATESFVKKSGVKLISDCPTRWSSSYLMVSRLLKVKSHFAEVLDELGWDNIPNSQWKQIENIFQLLKPFDQYATLTSAEESTTISMVIPVIVELQLHLEQMNSTHGISQIANTMSCELVQRFRYATDASVSDFDPLYVTSTFLNPSFRDILNMNQIASARTHITQIIKTVNSADNVTTQIESTNDDTNHHHAEEHISSSTETSADNRIYSEEMEEPRSKRFKHLHMLLIEKCRYSTSNDDFSQSEKDVELEIEHYIKHKPLDDLSDDDPLNFCLNNAIIYPKISSISLDLLATPASTAPVERIFSIGGEATMGKRKTNSCQS